MPPYQVPSAGCWALALNDAQPMVLRPGATMRLSKLTLPFIPPTPSKIQGNRHMLILHKLNDQGLLETSAVLGTVIRGMEENVKCNVRLFAGDVYVLELTGGGQQLHISGDFADESSQATVFEKYVESDLYQPPVPA